jgi:hypothetical protein
MYDGQTQFLIECPINHYLFHALRLSKLKKNAVGPITCFFRRANPARARESTGGLQIDLRTNSM